MGKTKIRFFTIADYEEEEIWLRKQHQNGLRLVKFVVPCFFFFEECAPEDVVYRLDYKNGKQSGDYMQMFRDYGWEYCASCVGWLYFRKPALQMQTENDGEIFSDNATKVEMLRHIVQTRMLPLLVIFLCCILPNWLLLLDGTMDGAGIVLSVVFSALLLLYLYIFFHCGLKLRKLRRKYDR